ncbi:hypothetical protein LIER_05543 [Lithospermum erythrorhizon]|uniref:UBN2 domain-containing protein n=1 Tax=Lithospermum erythrorhizon TaxID=34254 RepID=A0AAV3P2I0_LITER
MSNEKLIREILKTLPKKFVHKVIAIEKAQDLTTMSVNELIGNLTTFEMSLDDGELSKRKRITLKVASNDVHDEVLGETMNMEPVVLDNKTNQRVLSVKNVKDICIFMCYVLTLTDDDSKNKMVKKRKLATFFAFIVETEPQVADSLDDNNENEDVMTEEELLKDYKLLYTK